MKIEMWRIDQIQPYENNQRLSDVVVDAVAASLKEFGWRQPVVVDKDGVIVVGHMRWRGAQKLGLTVVPVHVAGDLTPTQARVYRIADNATAAIPEWDRELSPIKIGEIAAMNFDFKLLHVALDLTPAQARLYHISHKLKRKPMPMKPILVALACLLSFALGAAAWAVTHRDHWTYHAGPPRVRIDSRTGHTDVLYNADHWENVKEP